MFDSEAGISVEALFEEDFTPAWLVKEEQQVADSLLDLVTTDVEFKYRQESRRSLQAISAKFRQWYN